MKITTTLFLFLFGLSNILFSQINKAMSSILEEKWITAESELSSSNDPESMFYKTLALYKIEEKEKALNVISTMPTENNYTTLAKEMLNVGDGNKIEVKNTFDEMMKTTKNKDARLYSAMAMAIMNSKASNKDLALEYAKKAVELQPENFDFRIICGEAYSYNQEGGPAISQFENAQRINPKSAFAIAKVGKVYFTSKIADLALENLEKAIALDPNCGLAYNYLSQIKYRTKKYDEAKSYQQKFLDNSDKLPEDMAQMANILFKSKDYKGVIAAVEEALSKSNKYLYLNRLIGYSYFEEGGFQKSYDFLNKFIAEQPKEKLIASDYIYLAKASFEVRDTSNIENYLNKAIELNKDDLDAIMEIAEIYKSQKNYTKVIELYKMKINAPEPTLNDYFKLGNTYLTVKDYENAEMSFSKVIELNPNEMTAYYQRANCKLYSDPNQTVKSAKEDFIKFIELSKEKEEKYKKQIVKASIYLATDAILKMNDKSLAKTHLDKVIALDPTNSEISKLEKEIN